MLIPPGQSATPTPFACEALRRLPLAEAVLTLWLYVLHPRPLEGIYCRHRGRSFEGLLSFSLLVELIADALILHRGSARQSFRTAQDQGRLSTGTRAAYAKLGRVPLGLSLGFLEDTTARMRALLPTRAAADPPRADAAAAPPPGRLGGLTVIILDGKKIKDAAKRLKPLRGTPGKVFGGKLLVAYRPDCGLAVAMAADPDGEANDIRLVPGVLPRARAVVAGPRLWVADRQFCDLIQPGRFVEDGDHFLLRCGARPHFHADADRPAVVGRDHRGRVVTQRWGWLGGPADRRRRHVRRIELARPGEETIALVTDLLEEADYPAADLLEIYLGRWGIERVFQQITEVFDLRRLIGGTPQATIFQAAFCLVLYNLIQVVRGYVAAGRPEPTAAESLSAELIFDDAKDELVALNKVLTPAEVAALFPAELTASEASVRLTGLLAGAWSPRWVKAVNTKPRPKRPKAKGSGAHTSVHKVLVAHRRQQGLVGRSP